MDKLSIKGVLLKGENQYWINASSNDIDRDREIVQPAAFKESIKTYMDNPVILAFHDHHSFPIGKATEYTIGSKYLRLKIEFADTDRGREAKYLYDNGFMNSFSIGFIPKTWEDKEDGIRIYKEAELLEVSAVPIPANTAARMLREYKAKGLKVPDWLDVPTKPPVSEDESGDDELEAMKSKAKWRFEHDRTY